MLLHEWLFATFVSAQLLRLAYVGSDAAIDVALHAALLLAQAVVIIVNRRRPTPATWQLRLWFFLAAMCAIYFTMHSAVPAVATWRFDALLGDIDTALFGATLSARAEAIAYPLLTELLSGCYLLFFPYLTVAWLTYARAELQLFRAFTAGFMTIYAVGFFGYAFTPAAGPWIAFAGQFAAPLDGWLLTRTNAAIVDFGCSRVDVFPSLHCAITFLLLRLDRRHAPRRFRLLLLPSIGLCVATVYLRYHYFADVVAGLALGAIGLWVTNCHLARPRTP